MQIVQCKALGKKLPRFPFAPSQRVAPRASRRRTRRKQRRERKCLARGAYSFKLFLPLALTRALRSVYIHARFGRGCTRAISTWTYIRFCRSCALRAALYGKDKKKDRRRRRRRLDVSSRYSLCARGSLYLSARRSYFASLAAVSRLTMWNAFIHTRGGALLQTRKALALQFHAMLSALLSPSIRCQCAHARNVFTYSCALR